MIENSDYEAWGDLDSLDFAFELPPGLLRGLTEQTAGRMRHLYEVLVSRMRREAEHLSMGTSQQMKISRLATSFVTMIALEQSDNPDPKDVQVRTMTWLKISDAFDAMIIKSAAASTREAYSRKLSQAIAEVLIGADIDDDKREALVRDMGLAIERAGL